VKTLVTIVLCLLVGCTSSIGLEGMPDVPFRPIATGGFDPGWWRTDVEFALTQWNNALAPFGCGTLRLAADGEDGYAITLYPADDTWPWADSFTGMTVNGGLPAARIDIRDRIYRGLNDTPVTVHELGHALGLEHDDVTPGSVMTTKVGVLLMPNATDSQRAADSLGCKVSP